MKNYAVSIVWFGNKSTYNVHCCNVTFLALANSEEEAIGIGHKYASFHEKKRRELLQGDIKRTVIVDNTAYSIESFKNIK